MSIFVAVDIGGTHIRVATFEPENINPIVHKRAKTKAKEPGTFDRLVNLIESAWPENDSVQAIGMASPGPLDPYSGVILSTPNIPEWDEFPLTEKLTPARKAVFAAGTPITVVTSSTLSTKTNQTGEPFQASLANDLADGDWVVARKGASVTGVISDSDPGGRVKGVASITLQLKKLMLADGREVSISTTAYGAEAKSSKKKDAARIGIGAGIGAAVGAIAGGGKGAAIGAGVGGAAGTGATLAKRGDPAAIPSETPIRFELTAPLEIVEQK